MHMEFPYYIFRLTFSLKKKGKSLARYLYFYSGIAVASR